MLGYVITFFVITVITGLLGFGVATGTAAIVVRSLCGGFAILLFVALFRGTVSISRP